MNIASTKPVPDRRVGHAVARRAPRGLALATIVLLGVVLRALVFDPYGIVHVDEMIQYLERANQLVSGYGIVAWEQRFGIRNWLIPQLLARPMWVAAKLGPGTLAPVLAARVTATLAGLTMIVSAYAIGRRTSPLHALAAAFALAVWYQGVYFSNSLLSEALAAAAILGGIALAIGVDATRWRLVVAGLLLGLGLLLRFPYVVFVGIAAIGLNQLDFRRWGWMAVGGLLALAVGAVSDIAAGITPYHWLWQNFEENIAAGQSQRFGVEGPWFYPLRLYDQFGPVLLALCGLALLCPARQRFLLIPALADIVAHSLLAHKELRFVYLSTTTLVLLSALATASIAARIAAREPHRARIAQVLPFALMALMSASAWIYGQARAPFQIANPAAPLAADAVRHHAICGLILSDAFRYSVPQVFLGRALPLYSEHRTLRPGVSPDARPIPRPALAAADAIVAPRSSPIPAEYRRMRCLPQANGRPACLFVRPGGCNGATGQSYLLQNVLIASKL